MAYKMPNKAIIDFTVWWWIIQYNSLLLYCTVSESVVIGTLHTYFPFVLYSVPERGTPVWRSCWEEWWKHCTNHTNFVQRNSWYHQVALSYSGNLLILIFNNRDKKLWGIGPRGGLKFWRWSLHFNLNLVQPEVNLNYHTGQILYWRDTNPL